MDNVYILNPETLVVEGIIDSYTSIIWTPAYSDVGDFELYLGASKSLMNLLQINHYAVRSRDITVVDGVTTFRKVMIIKSIDISTDVSNGDVIIARGRELKYLLHQRIVWSQTNLSGTAEAGIRQLVTENAISPTDAKRKIPDLVLGDSAGLDDDIKKQITGKYLDEAVAEICKTYSYGWDVYINDGELVFIVYAGLNRSYEQTDHPYVVFSDSFDNLYNTDYQVETENYANTALIAGEGEGTERTTTTVGDDAVGLERYETYCDARDLSQNKDTEDEITTEEYIKLLQERGLDEIAERQYTEGFSGEVLSDTVFVYDKDFSLGDMVTVINSYGISRNVKILSVIESEDASGERLIPQFNI